MVTDESPDVLGSIPDTLPDAPALPPQTSRAISLQNEFQTHPGRGLTPASLASLLVAAEQGNPLAQFDLFEDMEERDGHLAAEMIRRRRALTRLDWNIVPPPNPSAAEKKAALTLNEWVTDLPDLEELLFDTTDAIGKGFVCQEIEWARDGGHWLPRSIVHRPQSWFRFVRGYTQEIRLRTGGFGDPLQPGGWIVHTHKAKSGYLERASLFRVLVWPYLFKNYSVGDLAEFLEIYGIPLRLGKYPPGASDAEKNTLMRALLTLGHNAAGIVPSTMALEFAKAADGDAKASYEVMIDFCERTQSKIILGATLTSQAGRGSNTNALGIIHNEVRKDLTDSDAKQIAGAWTRAVVWPLALFNGLIADRSRCPRFAFNLQEPEDLANYAQSLPSLVALGLRIPRQWAQAKLGIPEPEEGDADILQPAQAAAPPQPLQLAGKSDAEPAAAATARLTAQPPADDRPDPPALMTDRLGRNTAPALDAWIGQVRELAAKATSLQELRDGLLRLAPSMSLDDYAKAMTEALTAAALAGRFEVLREAGMS